MEAVEIGYSFVKVELESRQDAQKTCQDCHSLKV